MTNREEYAALCAEEKLPIFLQEWWLSGVAAGHEWDVLFSRDAIGKIRAAMPYMVERHLFSRFVVMPELCSYAGAWVREGLTAEELAQVAADFDAQLAALKVRYFMHRFPIGSPLPEAFQQIGYKLVNRTTHILQDTQDLEKVLSGFSRNKRQKLERRTLSYRVDTMPIEEFYRFHQACNAEKNKELWYTREMLLVQYEHAIEHHQAKIICIRSQEDTPLAAAVIVWDDKTLYQLLNCYIHETKDNGAREKLTLEVVRRAQHLGLPVDFVSHRSYLRHYGATRTEYVSVKHTKSPLISLIMYLRRIRKQRQKL